jgi:hypothetical protein
MLLDYTVLKFVSILAVFSVLTVGGLAQAHSVEHAAQGEIFETRWEATVLTVRWRLTDDQIHPWSTRGNHPPLPEARVLRRALCA